MVLPIGTTVIWRRGSEVVEGIVRAVHPRPVIRRINQVRVKRIGTDEDPAYEIEQSDGSMALKLHSEVEPRR